MKRFLLFLVFAVLFGGYAFAYDFSAVSNGKTLYYNITSSSSPYQVEVTCQTYPQSSSSSSYSSLSGSLTIPSSVTYSGRTYSVTSIGEVAFFNCSGLTSVTIPNSVTSIGDYAFYGCSGLTSVTIPNSVTSIGDGAFLNCSGLTSVTIPNSVTSIGDYAFYGCSGLTTVNFNATNCTTMGSSSYPVFNGCTSLTTLNIGENVTNIPANAFSGCSGLTTVNFNATNCTTMGSNVWNGCSSLSTLNIGENVTNIPANAFSGCSGLTTVNFNATNCAQFGYNNGISGNTNITTLNIGENVTNIPANAFSDCSGLTTVTVGSGVSNIGQNVFYNCSGLTRVVYTGSIAQWCGITFGNAEGNPLKNGHNLYINGELITNLAIPNSVSTINFAAFYGATCLNSVTIGNSVTSIGKSAFCYCSGLTSVTIPNSVDSIAAYAFYECNGLTSVTIPNSVTGIGNSAFYNCSGLTSVTIPNSVTGIGNSAFYNCSGLTTVNFNATNCTTMGSSSYPVFQNCNANATINIGEGVTTIPDYAFKGLLGNGILIIPSSVTSIGNSAFSGCSGLTSVTIPNSVTSIGNYAFSGCSGLTSVTIPNSVTSINNYAFSGCSGLTSVTIPNSVTSIGDGAFYNCSGLTSVTIPNSVASIGNSAFSGCNGLTTLNFNAENCTGIISGSLFDSNNTLSKITIGENVATIPNNAFKNCISLDSIISYASNPPVIYASTFDSQLSLNTPVVVPCGTVETYEDADFWYNFRHIQQDASCGTTYTITVLSSNNAYGTVSGGGTYMTNEVARLTATPNEGYRFSNWSDGSTENPHDVVVTTDATYIATFVQGGSSNPTVYNSIEATACGSYTWNDRTYTESGEYQQTFTAANSADSIVTLTLTIHPAPQPQITLYGELDACNPSSVAFATDQYQSYLWCNGATTMITSTSVPGYYYVEVTDENGCSGRSEQVNIGASNALTEAPQISVVGMNSENHNVVAWSALDNENVNGYNIYRENNVADVYEPMAVVSASETSWTDETADPSARAYRYKVTAVDQCGGESPMSDYHKTMHLTINRGIGNAWNLIWSHYEGFTFGTYRIYRGTSPSNMTMIGEVPSNLNSYTDNTATASTGFYYQVEVVRNTRSRDAEISSRSNIVDNGIITEYTITVISANLNRGTVTGGGTYPAGTVISIEAIANEGFEFASWSDDNTDNPRQITVTENATYVASFNEISSVPEYTITVISANPNRGTVTGGGTYPEGTVISIEAIANEGFEFASWSDENTDNPRQITVTADATYIASFDEVSSVTEHTITVMSANPNRGTVTGGGTYAEGTVVRIEATALEGFVFSSWSDENTDNPRYITVTGDATYIASFDPATGIEGNTAFEINLFPNPATDILNITSSETISEIEIVNVMGQVVRRIEVNSDNAVCAVEDWKAGVYMMRIHTEGTVVSQRKFVKE